MNEQSPKVINAEAQLVNDTAYKTLVENISKTVEMAHQKLATAVNTILIDTNWEIGRYIVEFEQLLSQKMRGCLTYSLKKVRRRLTY